MKIYSRLLGALLAGFLLLSGPMAVSAADTKKASAPQVDPMAGRNQKLIEKYYTTKGRVYEWTTELVKGLDPKLTGLPAKQDAYYLRLDKHLTDDYFRHMKAYDATTHEMTGDYLIAKDKSSVWRMDGDHPGMIYGSAEKLLKKSRLYVYPRFLTPGSKGFLRLEIPGNVPHEMKAKSMDEAIAKVDDKGLIEPMTTGRTNVIIDYVVGDQKGTEARTVNVVTQADLQRIAYASYVRQLYIERLMMYDDFWDPWPGWGPYYVGHHHHHGHRPPPPPPRHHRR